VPDEDPRQRRNRLVGAAGLATMGILHFAAPKAFDRIIPWWLPGRPRTWTHASGVAELASAALVASPRTSRLGGWAAALTFVGVYPANVQMAIDNPPTTPTGVAMLLRLPLQVPMVVWALRLARRPSARPSVSPAP
jgi:uncharacterized membrane protein